MVNDPVLIARVRDLAAHDLVERNVFGARCWVMDGHMCFGVHDDDLLLRLGPDGEGRHLRGFDPMGAGKPMQGWYLIEQEELAEDADLADWLAQATTFTAALPPK